MKTKKILVWALIIFFLIGGGFFLYKILLPNQQSTKIPPQDNPGPKNQKLTDQETEEYLLEKRLELKKYFVFNLSELSTLKKEDLKPGETAANWRWIRSNVLRNDLTKLTAECQKHLEKQGYKRKKNVVGKNKVSFIGGMNGNDIVFDDDWTRSLEQKITSGNYYIFFEKEKNYDWPFGWFKIGVDNKGQNWLLPTNEFSLATKNSSFIVCESKEKALELLKTDPTLVGRV